MEIFTRRMELSSELIQSLFGNLDENVYLISSEFGVNIKLDIDFVEISGEQENVELAASAIKTMVETLRTDTLDVQRIKYIIIETKNKNSTRVATDLDYVICLNNKLRPIKPKTIGQREYVENIEKNVVTFGIGPAGTGKTFLAIAMAIKALKSNEISRIILTRPAVEAGENLGFLPGDLQEKIDPYLRPLYDSLYTILGYENYLRLKEKNVIEVAPLAYMRGRTLDNCFIILDEAQNTSNEQMKMFLTRIGFGSKAVVTGDITQIDLSKKKKSGLLFVNDILKNINGIHIHNFTSSDVVRHSIVMKIIDAYAKYEKTQIKEEIQ